MFWAKTKKIMKIIPDEDMFHIFTDLNNNQAAFFDQDYVLLCADTYMRPECKPTST